MPVRELTERPQIPRLGKIRLGDRSGRNGAPVNKPHFVVPEEVAEVYGPEPTSLTIVFLSDDPEVIASSYYRAYNATNGLFCKGDGFRANASLDGDELRKAGGSITPLTPNLWAHGATGGRQATKEVVKREIVCAGKGYDGEPACPMFDGKKCAVRSFYQFAIKGVPGLGVYQMDTGSVINTKRMNGAIEMARVMLGGVAGVPMTLSRVQAEVSPDGIQKKVWTVDLKVATEHSLANLLEFRNGPVAAALLPPVDETEIYEGPDDDAVLEGEHRDIEQPEVPAGASSGAVASHTGVSDAPKESATTPPASNLKLSEEQMRTLVSAARDLRARDGGGALVGAIYAWAELAYPYAQGTVGWSHLELLRADCQTLIDALRAGVVPSLPNEPPVPVQAQAL